MLRKAVEILHVEGVSRRLMPTNCAVTHDRRPWQLSNQGSLSLVPGTSPVPGTGPSYVAKEFFTCPGREECV